VSDASIHALRLTVVGGRLAVCRFEPSATLPAWVDPSRGLFALIRAPSHVSVVCDETVVPADVLCERGFRALAVDGTIPFSATGVLASIAAPLAEAHVSIFALSTYDTDYVLVRASSLEAAIRALERAGHVVSDIMVETARASAEPPV
jgi:hypothetical protein